MTKLKCWGTIILTYLFVLPLFTQTDTTITIITRNEGDGIRFSSELRPLSQVPGAPPAYWLYFWEFGDGNFSQEETPHHVYTIAGDYDARLAVTAVYDDGDDLPPKKKTTQIVSNAPAGVDSSTVGWVADTRAIRLDNFQLPIPTNPMDLLYSYKNNTGTVQNGQLFIFFNEKRHEAELFKVDEVRAHHGELVQDPKGGEMSSRTIFQNNWVSSSEGDFSAGNDIVHIPVADDPWVLEAKEEYNSYREILFSNLAPGDERHFFITFDCTESMLVDTNELVTMQGIFLADNGDKDTTTLKMPVRDSHDPNLITVDDNRKSFRGFKNKNLDYRVQFQNEGDREARVVEIKCTLPEGMEAESIKVLETSPELPFCNEVEPGRGCLRDTILEGGNIVKFTFDGIYLAGTKQPGVKDRDSTIGYIEYRVKATKKVRKKTLVSRADIVFDNNENILTNKVFTRFKAGWSFGFRFGREIPGVACGGAGYFGGLSYSAYQPYNWYWQPELLYFGGEETEFDRLEGSLIDGQIQIDTLTNLLSTCNRIDLVPLQIRKNLGSFLGIGLGAQFSLERCRNNELSQVTVQDGGDPKPVENFVPREVIENNIRPAVFLDVNLGSSRIGPAIGGRYLYDFKGFDCAPDGTGTLKKHGRVQLYAIFRI